MAPRTPKSGLGQVLGQLLPYLAREKGRLALVVLIALFAAGAELLTLGLLLPFLEIVAGRANAPFSSKTPFALILPYLEPLTLEAKIRLLVVGMAILMSLRQAAVYLENRVTVWVRLHLDILLRKTVFDRILDLDMGRIYREKLSELFTVLNNFTGYTSALIFSCVSVIPQIVLLLLYLGILMALSWQLTLVSCLCLILIFFLMGPLHRRRREWGQHEKSIALDINNFGFEILSAMQLLRLFAREDHARENLDRHLRTLHLVANRSTHYSAMSGALFQISTWATMALLVSLATAVFTFDGATWVELVLLYIFVITRLAGPASFINAQRSQIASHLASAEKLVDFLVESRANILKDGTRTVIDLPGDVCFQNVSFRYAESEPKSLKSVSFTIHKGQITALVGPSGAGKSTVLALLSRMHDPSSGRITAGGIDLREFRIRDWRRQIGVVSQSTFLFNTTARENIRYGRLGATDGDVVLAAKMANAEEFLTRFPSGYDTELGDRGVRLSGGQAQRIAIARAVLSNPSLLILDEATSAQDSASERAVQEAVDRLSDQRTVVVVAHRLSTVRNADHIVVLDQGQVIEEGTHESLIAAKGRYAQLVELQDLGFDKSDRRLVTAAEGGA